MCGKWVPSSCVVVKFDSMKLGEKKDMDPLDTAKASGGNDGGDDDDKGSPAKETSPKVQNLDLVLIPSNIVKILHVCSNHKKPKKLILTLQQIYQNKDAQSGRFPANSRLCIVFFASIKTLNYFMCAELYGSLNQADQDR